MKRQEGAPVLGAIIESAAEASRDFPSFRRFAGLVSQVYGSSYGDYLTPSERAEYGDLHFEAETVVGLYLDAAASARRQGETDAWERWAQEASGVAASVLALAVKIRQGLREEELQRRSALVSLARAAGLPEEEARAVGCAFDDGGEADAFEVLCCCLFAGDAVLTREQAAFLASAGGRIGADSHLWRMVNAAPAEEPWGK